MAADFIIRPEHRMIFSYGWDTLTFSDLEDHRSRLFKDALYDPRFGQIANLSAVAEMQFSSNQIWSLAREPVLGPRSPRAVVAADQHYGLARIFHGYSEGQNVRIFRDLKQAAEWLDLPMEVADDVFAEIRRTHGLP